MGSYIVGRAVCRVAAIGRNEKKSTVLKLLREVHACVRACVHEPWAELALSDGQLSLHEEHRTAANSHVRR